MNKKRMNELNKLLPPSFQIIERHDRWNDEFYFILQGDDGSIKLDVDELGNCCGIASIENFDDLSGLPEIVIQAVIENAEYFSREIDHYTVAQCSIVQKKYMENVHKTILKCGWKKLYQFKNRNSGNIVVCYYKNLYS